MYKSFRSALLATTYHTGRIGRLDREEPFGRAMQIKARLAWVEQFRIADALRQFCSIVGDGDETDIEILSNQRLHEFQLQDFLARLERLKPHPKQDELGGALRRFDAAQALFELVPNRFEAEPQYPPLVSLIMKRGAEALFEIGRHQCVRLAKLVQDLALWAERRDHNTIAIIESPLGNSVPSTVFAEALALRGISATLVQWGCPRNEKALAGYTVKRSAKRLATNPAVRKADCVIFMDDALTGSRFMKMARELRLAVGTTRCLAIAMRFEFSSTTGFKPFKQRDLSDVEGWANAMGFVGGVVDFPSLPTFALDDGPAVALSSVTLWGDQDLVAGKRKANILFWTLDLFERIAVDLTSISSRYREGLQEVWSQEDTGRYVIFEPGVLDRTLIKLGSQIDVERLFSAVRLKARSEFLDDYLGVSLAPSTEDIYVRMKWLGETIVGEASTVLSINEAGLLLNAITAVNEAGISDEQRGPTRDHAYGHYSIPWARDLLELHRSLCRLIVREIVVV